HALKITFVNARNINPEESADVLSPAITSHKAPKLDTVSYPDLWEDISVVYECTVEGVVKSTYYVAPSPGASGTSPVESIRLRYNVPVSIDNNGNLLLAFETGYMKESAPIAWQIIGGVKVPVDVSFRSIGDCETGFSLDDYDPRYPLIIDPVMTWNTFFGSADSDMGYAIDIDGSGNIYVAGVSEATWGSPLTAYSGGLDAFVAKLNSSGALQWNTFLGSSAEDAATGIAVHPYISGTSSSTWGTPVSPYTGGKDIFAAKLNSGGVLQWNTFLGSADDDNGNDIDVDNGGDLFIAGTCASTWGAPNYEHSGGNDGCAIKLNSSGVLQFLSFLGSSGEDECNAVIVPETGGESLYAGSSTASWDDTSRVRNHAGGTGSDAFATKLYSTGALRWTAFLGSTVNDEGVDIALDDDLNVFVAGTSAGDWGATTPLDYSDLNDVFVTKLNNNGSYQWNSFLGQDNEDYCSGLHVDARGFVYVTGKSENTWGHPVSDYTGSFDVFAAKMNGSGNLLWNTFMGSASNDEAADITADDAMKTFVLGSSQQAWGAAKTAATSVLTYDTFVAELPGPMLTGKITNSMDDSGIEAASVRVSAGSGTAYTCKRYDGCYNETVFTDEIEAQTKDIYTAWVAPNIGLVRDRYSWIENGEIIYSGEYELTSYNNGGSTPHQYMPFQTNGSMSYRVINYSTWEPGNVHVESGTEVFLGSVDYDGKTYWGITSNNGNYLYIYRFDGDDAYNVNNTAVREMFGFGGLGKIAESAAYTSPKSWRNVPAQYTFTSRLQSGLSKAALSQNAQDTQDISPYEYLTYRFGINQWDSWVMYHSMMEGDGVLEEITESVRYSGIETIYTGDQVAFTDNEGNYEFYGLTPGRGYTVSVNRLAFGDVFQSGVTAGEEVDPVDLEITPTLLTGLVYDGMVPDEGGNPDPIPKAEVVLYDGGVKYENCKRFDFIVDTIELMPKPSGPRGPSMKALISYWLAPDIGIVQYTCNFNSEGDMSVESILDTYTLPGVGLHQYFPVQSGASWELVSRINNGSVYDYHTLDIMGYAAEGAWDLDFNTGISPQVYLSGNDIYTDSSFYVNNLLFLYGDGTEKIAAKSPASVSKAASSQDTEDTQNGGYKIFPLAASPGYEWSVMISGDTTVNGKYVGIEPVMVGNTRGLVNASAQYVYEGVQPGTYSMSAEAPGFEFEQKTGITVTGGTTNKVNFALNDLGYAGVVVPLAEAASMGLINQYCYTWDTSQGSGQYVPISATDNTVIPPWTGFWIAAYNPVILFFPGDLDQDAYVEEYDIIDTNEFVIEPDKWHLISPPLLPYNCGGYIGINNSIGDELGSGLYENTWRLVKWWFDEVDMAMEYFFFDGTDSVSPDEPFYFAPGKGFWLIQTSGTDKTIEIEYGENSNPGGLLPYAMPYAPEATEGDLQAYMSGNPYWFDIQWKDCKVIVDSDFVSTIKGSPHTVPKAVPTASGRDDKWHLRLGVESLDGVALDTYNNAGVMMTEGADNEYHWAFDLTPMAPYIRLQLNDPAEPDREALAYDYRAAGLEEYVWEVKLTTTYDTIDTKLSITDFEKVPEGFQFTLKDTDTGEVYAVESNKTFDVNLSSVKERTFLLTAIDMNHRTVDADNNTQPVAFGISSVRPNPFNASTTIMFGLEQAGNVQVRIYNLAGQIVETIVKTDMDAGVHDVVWEAVGKSSGMYMVSVESDGKMDTRKITYMK
ncbi:T9SS type A sorting domain-containing protein, partial [Candidatus Latescibacterota bacterium]